MSYTAVPFMLNSRLSPEFHFAKDRVELARHFLKTQQYVPDGVVLITKPMADAEAVAEEMFDLSNNPSRQEERYGFFGRSRSISVGDIISVLDNDKLENSLWLCEPAGWVKLA